MIGYMKMSENLISDFVSEDGNRNASVLVDPHHIVVRCRELNQHTKQYEEQWVELFSDKSLHYAEDMAENYVMYIGKFKK